MDSGILPPERSLPPLQGAQKTTWLGLSLQESTPCPGPASLGPTCAQMPAPACGSVVGSLTIFDLGDIPNHDLSHRDLDHLASPDHGELLLLFNAALQAPELFLFAPVIEGRDQDHADDREEDGGPLDPARLRLPFIFCPRLGRCTSCRQQKEAGGVGQPGRRGLTAINSASALGSKMQFC